MDQPLDLGSFPSLRAGLLVTTLLGLGIALAARHGGFPDLYASTLTFATLPVMLYLIGQIFAKLREREFGLDVIALLSMSSALFFGEYLTGAVVGLMYAGGQYLESIAEGRARREMTALLTGAPRTAVRRLGEALKEVSIEDIAAGDRLVVRRGDIVPVDGVLEDDAFLDEAALTGEPFPVTRKVGEPVRSGATNAGDIFGMSASLTANDSTYAGIIRLVEAAHRSKAPMSRLADRYGVVFLVTTVVLATSAWLISGDPIRGVAVLVIATPCPLILAVPVAWTAGMSRAAKAGLLVKGADVLERLGKIKSLVIDKTGTLTDGRPHLGAIVAAADENELLRVVASLDQGSSHVAAKALVEEAHSRNLRLSTPVGVTEKPGEGIAGLVEGMRVEVGGQGYIGSRLSSEVPEISRPDMMSALVAIDGIYAGTLLFSDPLREGASEALAELRRLGITRIILATGDRAEVASAVAKGLPLDEVRANLTPEEKIELVRQEALISPVLMVGDGINDAPALAVANVGIAMGAHGSAAAVETADAALLVERLDRICAGIEISRDCRRIAVQSVVVGIGLSACGMIFASAGFLMPLEGAVLQEAIDVTVVLNALRALRLTAVPKYRFERKEEAAAPVQMRNVKLG